MFATSSGVPGLRTFLAVGLLLPFTGSFAQTAFMPDYLPADPARYCARSYAYTGSIGGAQVSALSGTAQVPYRSGAVTAVWMNGVPGSPSQHMAFVNDGKRLIAPAGLEEGDSGRIFLYRDCASQEPAPGTVFDSVTDGALIDQGPYYGTYGGSCLQLNERGRQLLEIQRVTVRGVTYEDAVVMWSLDTAKPYRTPDFKGKDKDLGLRLPTASRTGGAALTSLSILGKSVGYIAGGDLDASSGTINFFWELSGVTCQGEATLLETGVWTAAGPPEERITALAAHPRDSSIVLAAASGGLFRTTNAGDTWLAANLGVGFGYVSSIAFAPSLPDVVYAGTQGRGLFKSYDAGRSWLQVAPDLNVQGVAVHPQDANIVYVAGDSDPGHRHIFGDLGVFASRDGGFHWTRISDFNAVQVTLVPGSPTTVCAGTSLGEIYCKDEKETRWTRRFQARSTGSDLWVDALVFDPRDPRVAYVAARSAGLQKTTDGGSTWSQLLTGVSTLILDPATGDLYAGAGPGALRSTDGGATWTNRDTLLAALQGNSFKRLALAGKYLFCGADAGGIILRSPDKGRTYEVSEPGIWDTRSVHVTGNGRILASDSAYGIFQADRWSGPWRWAARNTLPTAAGSATVIASHVAAPDRIFATTNSGLLRSTDAGDTWSRVTGPPDLPMGTVTDLAFDAAGATRLYALSPSTGVWITEDGGDNWARLADATGLPFAGVLAAESGEGARLYAAGPKRGLYGSDAGGRAWRRLAADNPVFNDVLAVAVGPGTSKTVWAGTNGFMEGLNYHSGGLYTSADFGETWKAVVLPATTSKITQIVFDPVDSATLYVGAIMSASGADTSVLFRSTDGGATWKAFPTGVSSEFARLAPDPTVPGRVFAANSVFGVLAIQTTPTALP